MQCLSMFFTVSLIALYDLGQFKCIGSGFQKLILSLFYTTLFILYPEDTLETQLKYIFL